MSIKNVEELIGEKIIDLIFLENKETSFEYKCIEKVIIQLSRFTLLIEIDINFDEIKFSLKDNMSFDSAFQDQTNFKDFNMSKLCMNNAIGYEIIWFWLLKNQKGYIDGIQIEIKNKSDRIQLQFMVEASSMKIYQLSECRLNDLKE